MGKAGKWVVNFLLGKKQLGGGGGNNNSSNKISSKTTDSNGLDDDCSIETASAAGGSVLLHPPQTPSHNHKRRWSFGKSLSKDRSSSSGRRQHHNTTTTTIVTATTFNPLLQASSNDAIERLLLGPSLGNNEAVSLAINEAIRNYETKSNPSQAAADREERMRVVAGHHVAATRIQAAFRSFLARKALAALKALVKLQALARGHLVRKHMSATIRKMHAVMSIQVRARFQRMQMNDHSSQVEEKEEVVDDQSSKVGASNKKIKRSAESGLPQKKNDNSKDGNLDNSERITTRRHSGDLSFLKRERPLEDQASYTYSYSSTQTSPATARHSRASQQVGSGGGPAGSNQDSFLEPSYMGKTQSSNAKSRSHSEPRQRPRKSISSNTTRRSPSSNDGTNSVHSEIARLQFSSSSASQSKRLPGGELQDQWFIKLYRSTIAPPPQEGGGGADYYRDGDREMLVACEPHLNMY